MQMLEIRRFGRVQQTALLDIKAQGRRGIEAGEAAKGLGDRDLAALTIQRYWRGKKARMRVLRIVRAAHFARQEHSMRRHDENRWLWQDAGNFAVQVAKARARRQAAVCPSSTGK